MWTLDEKRGSWMAVLGPFPALFPRQQRNGGVRIIIFSKIKNKKK